MGSAVNQLACNIFCEKGDLGLRFRNTTSCGLRFPFSKNKIEEFVEEIKSRPLYAQYEWLVIWQ